MAMASAGEAKGFIHLRGRFDSVGGVLLPLRAVRQHDKRCNVGYRVRHTPALRCRQGMQLIGHHWHQGGICLGDLGSQVPVKIKVVAGPAVRLEAMLKWHFADQGRAGRDHLVCAASEGKLHCANMPCSCYVLALPRLVERSVGIRQQKCCWPLYACSQGILYAGALSLHLLQTTRLSALQSKIECRPPCMLP